MVGITDLPVMQSFGWFLRKIWRKIYKRIEVDVEGLKKVTVHHSTHEDVLFLIFLN